MQREMMMKVDDETAMKIVDEQQSESLLSFLANEKKAAEDDQSDTSSDRRVISAVQQAEANFNKWYNNRKESTTKTTMAPKQPKTVLLNRANSAGQKSSRHCCLAKQDELNRLKQPINSSSQHQSLRLNGRISDKKRWTSESPVKAYIKRSQLKSGAYLRSVSFNLDASKDEHKTSTRTTIEERKLCNKIVAVYEPTAIRSRIPIKHDSNLKRLDLYVRPPTSNRVGIKEEESTLYQALMKRFQRLLGHFNITPHQSQLMSLREYEQVFQRMKLADHENKMLLKQLVSVKCQQGQVVEAMVMSEKSVRSERLARILFCLVAILLFTNLLALIL